MGMTITHEHLQAARLVGACDDVTLYREGTPISRVPLDHLRWFAKRFPEWANEAAKTITAESGLQIVGTPALDLLSHDYRDGDGYGSYDGCGSGCDYGYLPGYCPPDMEGYGSGYGYGCGYGCGCRSGYGYGCGYGDGGGDGYGDGAYDK